VGVRSDSAGGVDHVGGAGLASTGGGSGLAVGGGWLRLFQTARKI